MARRPRPSKLHSPRTMGLTNFLLLPWYAFKFLISAIVIIGSFALANALLILAIVVLFTVAENQTTLFANANALGNTLAQATTYGQSMISVVSNCLRTPKLAWNHFFEFIFALTRVATAGTNIAFPNFPFSTRGKFGAALGCRAARCQEEGMDQPPEQAAYPADSRFTVQDIICDVILPMFESVLNVVLIFGNFGLDLFRRFVILIALADPHDIDFSFMYLFVSLIVDPLLDKYDPGNCIHPFSGPRGYPGAPLHCMDCSLTPEQMNEDDTTKTNALLVCYCGGDLHDTAYNIIIDCMNFNTVITFFTSLGNSIVSAALMVGNLNTYKDAANTVWNGIQSVWNSIEGILDEVKGAICKIPFVCKILKIRSTLHRGVMRDDAYICSYDTRVPGGDTDPFCFYESEFWPAHAGKANFTDAARSISDAWFAAASQIGGIRADGIHAMLAPPRSSRVYNATDRARMYRERFIEARHDDENALLQAMKIARIFLATGLQVLASGRNVGPEHLIQRFRADNVQPHHIPIGIRKYAARAGLKPYMLPWTPATYLDHERMHANGSPTLRFAEPPPINFFGSILATSASISWRGVSNASAFISAIVQTLASVGLMVASIVIKLAIGLLQSIFPSALITTYTFNPLTDLVDIFTPLYADAQRGPLPAAIFTAAWGDFANVFNNVISSQIGVEIVHYIFTVGAYVTLDPNNVPAYHPSITSVNALLTTTFNCNPQGACVAPIDCNFAPCDCRNGTIVYLSGFCSALGRCKCFPLFDEDAGGAPANTISISMAIDPVAAGYVPENIVWNAGFLQAVANCVLDAWNGALPYLASLLIHNAANISIMSVALNYTVGWCKCCNGLTSFLMKITLVLGPLGIAVSAWLEPALTYCTPRSVWYCAAFSHFFRPTAPGFSDFLLFWANFGPSTAGLFFIAAIVLIPLFALWMLLGASALVGLELFNIATYGVQHDLTTRDSNDPTDPRLPNPDDKVKGE